MVVLSLGSSPHSRGTQKQLSTATWQLGIIPALAGNTRIKNGNLERLKDHPRTRGEHLVLV